MADESHDARGNVINFADWCSRKKTQPRPETRVKDPLLIERDPDTPLAVAYLDDLLAHEDISLIERNRLGIALLPLNDIVGPLEDSTLALVRQEMDEPNPPPSVLSESEAKLWDNATKSPIPGFDHNLAFGKFLVTREEDPEQEVLFFPDVKPKLKYYVPSWLNKAQLFFYIMLRMYRIQYEQNKLAQPLGLRGFFQSLRDRWRNRKKDET